MHMKHYELDKGAGAGDHAIVAFAQKIRHEIFAEML